MFINYLILSRGAFLKLHLLIITLPFQKNLQDIISVGGSTELFLFGPFSFCPSGSLKRISFFLVNCTIKGHRTKI